MLYQYVNYTVNVKKKRSERTERREREGWVEFRSVEGYANIRCIKNFKNLLFDNILKLDP